MNSLKSLLYNKSRDRFFLWKLGIGTILLGVLLGFLTRYMDFDSGATPQTRIQSYISANSSGFSIGDSQQQELTDTVYTIIEDSLITGSVDTKGLILEMSFLQLWMSSNQLSKYEKLFKQHLPEDEVEILLLYINALGNNSEPAKTALLALAQQTSPRRFANQILGIIASEEKLSDEAYSFYLKEGSLPDAQWARDQAVVNRLHKKDFGELNRLVKEPNYQDAFSPWIQIKLSIHNKDWAQVIRWLIPDQLSRIQMGSFILATISMLVWSVILFQLGQISNFDKLTPLLCFAGLLLGILSINPTMLWIYLEGEFLPISEGDTLIHTIVYYVATVGLREEVCKLLLVLPLVPILIKRNNEMEFLLVASFVGLGFAYAENFSYLSDSMGTAVMGRFLTANFLHTSLTGMSCLFFCRACRTRGYGFNEFFYIFGIAVVAHGLYDAFLVHPPMEDGGMFAMILYILFSKFYFQEAHKLRQNTQSTISLTATMVFGFSLLIASLLVYLSITLDLALAIKFTANSFLGSAIILFMFFREFDERLLN